MIDAVTGAQGVSNLRATGAAAPAQELQPSHATSRLSAFEVFAQKFDIRSMTPREIDAMAEAMPIEKPGDTEVKMMLLTRGAKFQEGLAKVVAEATGQPFGEAERAALQARLDTPIDLIKSFEDLIDMSRRHGEPTEAAERALGYLHQMEARRLLPEGGVTV